MFLSRGHAEHRTKAARPASPALPTPALAVPAFVLAALLVLRGKHSAASLAVQGWTALDTFSFQTSPTGHRPHVPQVDWGAPCSGHWGAPASLTPAVSMACAEGSPAEADVCAGQRSASSTDRLLGQNFCWLSSTWCIVPEALGSDGTLLTRHPALWREAE